MKEKSDGFEERIMLLLQSQEEFRKSQEEFRKSLEEEARKREEEARKREEEDRKIKNELDKMLKTLSQEVGKISDSVGRFAEGLVAPCLKKIFRGMGVKIIKVSQRYKAHMNGRTLEIDLFCIGRALAKNKLELVEGENIAILVEVKSFLQAHQITDFINSDIPQFHSFFEEYRDYPIVGAVAGMNIERGADTYAQKQGLFVLTPAEDNIKLLNPKGFKPKVWKLETPG